MAEHARIVRVARYRPRPGSADELRDALHALAAATRGLPGVFGAQVCRIREDLEWMAFVTRWENEEAMRGTGEPVVEELVNRVAGLGEEQQVEHFIVE